MALPPRHTSEPKKYEWLLCDADGTLFDYDRAERTALAEVFRRNQVPFDPLFLATYRSINQSLWLDLEKKRISPEVLKLRRFELLLQAVEVSVPATRFSELYLECLSDCSELVDGAAAAVRQLHQDFKIAIVTNGLKAVQRPRVERSAIRDYVSALIISEEIGHAKPASEFFDAAFALLGHPRKDQVLMVGDGWSSDIQGAADYGLDTCWFNPGRRPRPAAPPLTFEIGSWGELLTLVPREVAAR